MGGPKVNIGTLVASDGAVGVNVSTASESAHCTLPSYDDVAFVGREGELAALDAWRASSRRVLVVHGDPGVGKTRLVTDWAHRQDGAFPGGRYFVSFRADPYEALLEIARLHELERQPDERIDQWAIRTLRVVGGHASLFVFDDMQDPEAFAVWLRWMSRARVVVVTNTRTWPNGYGELPVEPLTEVDARALATSLFRDARTAALHVEGVVARAQGVAVQLVVDASSLDRDARMGRPLRSRPAIAQETASSFERAWSSTTADARVALCALARYRAQGTPPARVAEVLAADGWSRERCDEALVLAVEARLAARDEAGALTMHPLLREFARGRAAEVLSATVLLAHTRALVARASAFASAPGDRAKYEEMAHDELDVAVWDGWSATLSWDDRVIVGAALWFAGRFGDAKRWHETAAAVARVADESGRVDHRRIGGTLHQVGVCLSEQRQFAQAQEWYERAAEEYQKGDPQGCVHHQLLGDSLHCIGFGLTEQGQFAQAQEWCERAAGAYRKGDAHGRVNHDSLGKTLHQVGICMSRRGRFAQAQQWYERAVDEQLKGDVLGRVDHDFLGASLFAVGFCFAKRGQLAQAQQWYERAADQIPNGDVHGRVNHSGFGKVLRGMGLCLQSQNQPAEALVWIERAVAESRLGDIYGRIDHAALAASLDSLALALDVFGRSDEAQAHRDEAARLRAPAT